MLSTTQHEVGAPKQYCCNTAQKRFLRGLDNWILKEKKNMWRLLQKGCLVAMGRKKFQLQPSQLLQHYHSTSIFTFSHEHHRQTLISTWTISIPIQHPYLHHPWASPYCTFLYLYHPWWALPSRCPYLHFPIIQHKWLLKILKMDSKIS